MGNVEAKDLIYMTYGHELKRGNAGKMGCEGWKGIKEEKCDNCNSIINKAYLKKKRTSCLFAFRHVPFQKSSLRISQVLKASGRVQASN